MNALLGRPEKDLTMLPSRVRMINFLWTSADLTIASCCRGVSSQRFQSEGKLTALMMSCTNAFHEATFGFTCQTFYQDMLFESPPPITSMVKVGFSIMFSQIL